MLYIWFSYSIVRFISEILLTWCWATINHVFLLHCKLQFILIILFRPFGFITHKTLNYLAFQSLDFERTWWRLFQKRVVRAKLDIYGFIIITGSIPSSSSSSSSSSSIKVQGCSNNIFTLSLKQPCLRKGETMYN